MNLKLLKLRVKDLKGKDRLCIIEQKTGKPKYLPIPLTFNKTILQTSLDVNMEEIYV